ncbi:MAG: hypothetical protein CYPHOPRED_004626 [Cyphobasidiales sp. Tagirdzhanova-0007]|nr:MAG: hypothetical protein CYPHOPRED_004626 [Cyphobasidiales sp. Tagirdzhanova-0007]
MIGLHSASALSSAASSPAPAFENMPQAQHHVSSARFFRPPQIPLSIGSVGKSNSSGYPLDHPTSPSGISGQPEPASWYGYTETYSPSRLREPLKTSTNAAPHTPLGMHYVPNHGQSHTNRSHLYSEGSHGQRAEPSRQLAWLGPGYASLPQCNASVSTLSYHSIPSSSSSLSSRVPAPQYHAFFPHEFVSAHNQPSALPDHSKADYLPPSASIWNQETPTNVNNAWSNQHSVNSPAWLGESATSTYWQPASQAGPWATVPIAQRQGPSVGFAGQPPGVGPEVLPGTSIPMPDRSGQTPKISQFILRQREDGREHRFLEFQ